MSRTRAITTGDSLRDSRRNAFDIATKTRGSQRRVELVQDTAALIATLRPPEARSDDPVFATPEGPPMEYDPFRKHFLKALKALGIRQRGPYALKDTFISLALTAGVNVHWLEAQTGVRYETMRRHYGHYMRSEGVNELAKLVRTSEEVQHATA